MNASVTLSLIDFLNLAETVLGHRRHLKELVDFYRHHPDKVKFWLKELDLAVLYFNQETNFPKECINANYLKSIINTKLPQTGEVLLDTQLFNPTLAAMDKFEFFDNDWDTDKLAAACIVAFYRTYVLTKYPFLNKKKAQVASAIEEILALMALKGKKTELFEAIKFWIKDWQGQGFSKALANNIIIAKL